MLTPKLKEVKERLQRKASHERTPEEGQLLKELHVLDELLDLQPTQLRESISKHNLITSGPSDRCACCGK